MAILKKIIFFWKSLGLMQLTQIVEYIESPEFISATTFRLITSVYLSSGNNNSWPHSLINLGHVLFSKCFHFFFGDLVLLTTNLIDSIFNITVVIYLYNSCTVFLSIPRLIRYLETGLSWRSVNLNNQGNTSIVFTKNIKVLWSDGGIIAKLCRKIPYMVKQT